MTDVSGPTPDASGPSGDDGGRRVAVIATVVVVLIALVVGLVFLLNNDDDDDDTADTVPTTETPATDPPATDPPATDPPATDPPATDPPATDPPATDPPATDPPATDPPATDPPATDPPATDPPATDPPTTDPPATDLEFTIADIEDGGTIPVDFTCDGTNAAPTVTIESVPDGVMSFAMIVDDPDAPTPDPFVHWVVYEIPGDATEFGDLDPDAPSEISYGLTDVDLPGWFGPCPPPGDGPHGYVFTLFALDNADDLPDDLDGRELAAAIEGSVVAEAELVASYERAAS